MKGTHFLNVCTVTAASVTALWPQAPLKCLCLGEPGMAHSCLWTWPAFKSAGQWGGRESPPCSSSPKLAGGPAGCSHAQSPNRVGDTVARSVCPGVEVM